MIYLLFFCCLAGNDFCLKCLGRFSFSLSSIVKWRTSLFWYPGDCLGIEVHQTPPALIQSPGDKVQLVCTHEQTDYRVMLWYRQPPGQTDMILIGYVNYNDVKMEKSYERQFNISGDLSGSDAKNVSLIFQLTGAEDSAEYYCAAHYACWHKGSLLFTKTLLFQHWSFCTRQGTAGTCVCGC